ncbi:MAG: glycosyltransferase [Zestosphaera sp.]
MLNALEVLGLTLALAHFTVPLAYYAYAKLKWFERPWDLSIDENYKPKVTIIIPTYNESKLIEKKLDNIYEQDYPKELMEIVVVDSASTDGTPRLVEEWAREHPEVSVRLLEEPIRRGMNPALNFALKHVPGDTEIVVFTDADSFWPSRALKEIVKYFADPVVGAVTASILPGGSEGGGEIEERVYRGYYNILRVSESKLHSTPVHNGALVAYRLELIQRIGGIPEFTGNNDSTPASIIAFMGYRALQVDDVIVWEPIIKNQFRRRVRRAQHLLLSFLKAKQYARNLGVHAKSLFNCIWRVEWYLHVVNPWLLVLGLLLLMGGFVVYGSLIALALIGVGLALTALRDYRTWILTQTALIVAAVRNIWTKDIIWSK